ncbi:hypothetical protein AURDEDRAFT_174488 [Auricularia subglabra TFB-10046 SS5]|uniref:Uncharacterized protein n=1 Tax=Auricularia subglabra (strain TFB-10046 / SS5) TaxID=717982 RepID=J0WT24_AURST|nr:hypothetical protein AURDEDRAFT_174488 [Auricularia subglabra TFB-10046 SS5]
MLLVAGGGDDRWFVWRGDGADVFDRPAPDNYPGLGIILWCDFAFTLYPAHIIETVKIFDPNPGVSRDEDFATEIVGIDERSGVSDVESSTHGDAASAPTHAASSAAGLPSLRAAPDLQLASRLTRPSTPATPVTTGLPPLSIATTPPVPSRSRIVQPMSPRTRALTPVAVPSPPPRTPPHRFTIQPISSRTTALQPLSPMTRLLTAVPAARIQPVERVDVRYRPRPTNRHLSDISFGPKITFSSALDNPGVLDFNAPIPTTAPQHPVLASPLMLPETERESSAKPLVIPAAAQPRTESSVDDAQSEPPSLLPTHIDPALLHAPVGEQPAIDLNEMASSVLSALRAAGHLASPAEDAYDGASVQRADNVTFDLWTLLNTTHSAGDVCGSNSAQDSFPSTAPHMPAVQNSSMSVDPTPMNVDELPSRVVDTATESEQVIRANAQSDPFAGLNIAQLLSDISAYHDALLTALPESTDVQDHRDSDAGSEAASPSTGSPDWESLPLQDDWATNMGYGGLPPLTPGLPCESTEDDL